MIREARRDNSKKLGKNPDSETIYQTLGMTNRNNRFEIFSTLR